MNSILKRIIFLLDASASMKENNPNRLAIDSISQLIYSLPSDYMVSIVSYNNDINFKSNLVYCNERIALVKKAEEIQYFGYSSPGKGLKQALDILETSQSVEKNIIIVSDGKILLQNDKQTEAEITLFKEQVVKAKKLNTTINVVGIGTSIDDISSDIFNATKETSGSIYHKPKTSNVQNIFDDILTNQFKIEKSVLGVIESDGKPQSISVNLPIENISKARILLRSSKPINSFIADFSAENSFQDSGKQYALIELEHPTKRNLNITVDAEKGSKIKVDLIAECEVQVKTNITYIDTNPLNKNAKVYDRTANIKFHFENAVNPNKKMFTEDYFDKAVINAKNNGKDVSLFLQNGEAIWTTNVSNEQFINISLDYSNFPVNIINSDKIELKLEAPPIYEGSDTILYTVCIGVLFISIFILMLLISRKKRKQTINFEIKEESKYSYTGKLNVYITHTKNDLDISPLTFNLFHISNNRQISLEEVLNRLDVEEIFEGADKIYFNPDSNRKLIVTNNSDCTVMKNREIILKEKSIELFADSKLDISFEDEVSEMVVQYKDLK